MGVRCRSDSSAYKTIMFVQLSVNTEEITCILQRVVLCGRGLVTRWMKPSSIQSPHTACLQRVEA